MILKLVAAVWLGLSGGAMLAGGALLVPYWRTLAAADFFAWFAANAQRMFVFFTALQAPSALLAIAAAIGALRAESPDRALWMIAAACATAVFIPYFVFFQQANAGFVRGSPVQQIGPVLLTIQIAHSLVVGVENDSVAGPHLVRGEREKDATCAGVSRQRRDRQLPIVHDDVANEIVHKRLQTQAAHRL